MLTIQSLLCRCTRCPLSQVDLFNSSLMHYGQYRISIQTNIHVSGLQEKNTNHPFRWQPLSAFSHVDMVKVTCWSSNWGFTVNYLKKMWILSDNTLSLWENGQTDVEVTPSTTPASSKNRKLKATQTLRHMLTKRDNSWLVKHSLVW